MTTVHGLPEIAQSDATILVLGTMPGKASLHAREYYAHRRNSFWKVAGTIFGFEASLPYRERVVHLLRARIAVWDVLKLCTRTSSLDSDIQKPIPNEFLEFFGTYRQIQRVCFNGGAAEKLYKTHVLARITLPLNYRRLPSTSPANARVSFADKLSAWGAALR